MKNDFQTKHTQCANALDACGIGHDVQERFRAGSELIAKTAAAFIQKASDQLAYNLLTNAPCGIELDRPPDVHAVFHGLVTTITAAIQWDFFAARRIAAEILEDVNDHTEAAKLFAIATPPAEMGTP